MMKEKNMDTTIVFCFLLIVKIILWWECWQDKHLFFISLLGKLELLAECSSKAEFHETSYLENVWMDSP